MKKLLIFLSICVLFLVFASNGWARDGRGGPYPRVWTNRNLPSDEKNTDPTSADDASRGYKLGDIRLNQSNNKIWECVVNTNNAADWDHMNAAANGTLDGGVSNTVTVSGASIVQHDGTVPTWGHSPTGLAIEGSAEIDGPLYMDSPIYLYHTVGVIARDETGIKIGSSEDVSLVWEVNANPTAEAFNIILPNAGPSVSSIAVIGNQSIANETLGWFDGIVDPSIALVNNDKSGYTRFYTSTDAGASTFCIEEGGITTYKIDRSGATYPQSGMTEYYGTGGAGIGEGGNGEMYAMDDSGNSTKISAHNQEGEWEFYSENKRTGQKIQINMMDVIREVERMSGKSFIQGTFARNELEYN